MRILAVVNPTAGKGRARRSAPTAVAGLRSHGLEVDVLEAPSADEALMQLRAALAAPDHDVAAVVAVGGDGTVALALQAVAGTDVPLGVIAVGTGDDVARQHGLPRRDPVAAAARIAASLASGITRAVDAGLVTGPSGERRWFLTALASGFDSEVNEVANRMRWPSGDLRYVVAMLRLLPRFRATPYRVRVDDDESHHHAMLIAVGNGPSYGGGMLVCPDARTDDGTFAVTIVTPLSRPRFLALFPRVYRGTHVHHRAVLVRHGRSVDLAAAGRTAWADGERICALPIRVECVAGAVRLLA